MRVGRHRTYSGLALSAFSSACSASVRGFERELSAKFDAMIKGSRRKMVPGSPVFSSCKR